MEKGTSKILPQRIYFYAFQLDWEPFEKKKLAPNAQKKWTTTTQKRMAAFLNEWNLMFFPLKDKTDPHLWSEQQEKPNRIQEKNVWRI